MAKKLHQHQSHGDAEQRGFMLQSLSTAPTATIHNRGKLYRNSVTGNPMYNKAGSFVSLVQTLSITGDQLTISDGNTVTIPSGGGSLPSGSNDQTLRHNGTTWVANNALTISSASHLTVTGNLGVHAIAGTNTGFNVVQNLTGAGNAVLFNQTNTTFGVAKNLLRLYNAGGNGIVSTLGSSNNNAHSQSVHLQLHSFLLGVESEVLSIDFQGGIRTNSLIGTGDRYIGADSAGRIKTMPDPTSPPPSGGGLREMAEYGIDNTTIYTNAGYTPIIGRLRYDTMGVFETNEPTSGWRNNMQEQWYIVRINVRARIQILATTTPFNMRIRLGVLGLSDYDFNNVVEDKILKEITVWDQNAPIHFYGGPSSPDTRFFDAYTNEITANMMVTNIRGVLGDSDYTKSVDITGDGFIAVNPYAGHNTVMPYLQIDGTHDGYTEEGYVEWHVIKEMGDPRT